MHNIVFTDATAPTGDGAFMMAWCIYVSHIHIWLRPWFRLQMSLRPSILRYRCPLQHKSMMAGKKKHLYEHLMPTNILYTHTDIHIFVYLYDTSFIG